MKDVGQMAHQHVHRQVLYIFQAGSSSVHENETSASSKFGVTAFQFIFFLSFKVC